MVVIIVPASLSDAQEMLAIYSPYVTETTFSSEYEPPTCKVFEERIQTCMERLPWLICRVNGVVAGYAYAVPHRTRAGYQWSVETSIYVAPAFHRCGIAAALYHALFWILVRQGYYNIFVGITSPNERSIQFHKAMGFVISGSYQNSMYKFGQWHDVIWMAKNLRPCEAEPVPTILFSEIIQEAQTTAMLLTQAQTVKRPDCEKRCVHEEEE